ncbi:MAG: HD domain-containing protein, partial [Caldilineae bacterium]
MPAAPYDPYKNRWIAQAEGRVVGVGERAAQAYQAARQTCPKDRPRLFFVDGEGIAHPQPDNFDVWFEHPLLRRIARLWREEGREGYLVGGAVRDGLLGALDAETDLDLLVPAGGLDAARALANALRAAFYPLDAERDVGRIVFPDHRYLDVAACRGGGVLDDLRLRDFTINAIALRLDTPDPYLLDPLKGGEDLRQGVVRVASERAIRDDPLRAVRAVRIAARLGFTIEADTRRHIEAGASGLSTVSGERLRDELLKLLAVDKPGAAFGRLHTLHVLPHLLPEALPMVGMPQSPPHRYPLFDHTLAVMDAWAALSRLDDPRLAALETLRPALHSYFQTELAGNLSRAALMPFAALLHDIGKPKTFAQGTDGRIRFFGHPQVGADIARRVLNGWRFSRQATAFVVAIVRHHMRPLLLANQKTVSKRAIHRFVEAAGDAAPAVAFFALLDHAGIYGSPGEGAAWERLVSVVERVCRMYFAPRPPVLLTGGDLIRHFHLAPGPHIGQLLRRLREAQATGEANSREEALALVGRWLE